MDKVGQRAKINRLVFKAIMNHCTIVETSNLHCTVKILMGNLKPYKKEIIFQISKITVSQIHIFSSLSSDFTNIIQFFVNYKNKV